jgi:hypothetical protein
METKYAGLFVMLGLIFFQAACGHISGNIEKDPFGLKSGEISIGEQEEIKRLDLMLAEKNAGLNTVKGLGNIKIYNDDAVINSRLALIVDAAGKMRMAFLGIDGRPVMSLAVDDSRLYAYSHTDERLRTRKRSDNMLAPFLSINLPYDAVSAFLMGRIHMPEYFFARLAENKSGDGYVLSLLEKDSGDVEKIFFNRDKTVVSAVAYYKGNGELICRIMFNGHTQVQSYGLFSSVLISDGKKAVLEMEIDRFWVNMPVDPAVFKLSDSFE